MWRCNLYSGGQSELQGSQWRARGELHQLYDVAKQAELLRNGEEGNLVGVTGRIQTRNYENQEGRRVYLTEVIAENSSDLKA